MTVLLVLAGVAGMAAAGYVGWEVFRDRVASAPGEEDVAEAAARVEQALPPDARVAAREAVTEAHELLNQRIGYGALGSVDFERFRAEVAEPVAARLAEVAAVVDDPALTTDLETVRQLLTLGAERGDREALRLAHRVLHDLDHFAFNPERTSDEYWGATVTLAGEDNPAQRYLASLRSG